MFLTRIAVNNPVFTLMVMLAITLIGWFTYQRLAIEEFPSANASKVNVNRTPLPLTPGLPASRESCAEATPAALSIMGLRLADRPS